MAKKTIAQLTTEFSDGKTVSGSNFANIFDSNFNLSETGTSTAEGSLFLKGNLTANQYIVSSSVINKQILDVSGSTHFGDSSDDVHTRTGSMAIKGPINISGSIIPDFSGSFDLGSEAKPFREIYVMSSSINFMNDAGVKLATISVDADGKLETIPSGSTTPDPIASFPFTGDAVITGSLLISGSSQYFRVDADDVVIGYGAGANLDSGTDSYNVLIGYEAGHTLDNDNYTVLIGYQAGKLLDHSGGVNYSTYVGYQAGTNVTTGNKNVAVGYLALKDDATTGGENVVMGYQACQQGLGNNNVVLGGDAIRLTGAGTPDDNVVIGHQAGGSLSGNKNIFIGKQAGNTTTTGENNVLIGYDVEGSAVGASNELRIGYGTVHALSASLSTGDVLFPSTASAAYFSGDGSNLTNLPSSGATVLGDLTDVGILGSGADWSLFKNGDTPDGAPQTGSFSGVSNIAIGYRANFSATTDQYNIALGDSALYNSAGGDYNFAAGYQASWTNSTGTHNIAIGDRAVRQNSTANYNIGLGREALYSATGGGNIGIGQQSGRNISSGTNNIVIGYNTSGGSVPTTGNKNICLGMFIGLPDPTADSQFVLGHCHTNPHYLLSGDYATSNQSKLGINLGATGTSHARAAVAPTATLEVKGQGTTDATANLLIKNSSGTQIMKLTDSGENVCIGSAAGDSITATSGLNNILIGRDAGTAITTADNNIIIGAYAGDANTASSNIFIGYSAGTSNTTGTANTFIGYSAGLYVSDWQNNTFIGYNAGKYTANEKNTAVGAYAMQGTTSGGATTAELNTAIGFEALFLVDDNGDGNVAVGYQAGDSITSGTNNTVIGYGADANATGTNQIACGNGAVASGDNVGIWGNASVATNNITVDWTVTSDERIKENIQDSSLGLDFINELKPKTYTRKHPADWDEAILEDRFKEGGSEYDEETGTPIKGKFDTEKIHNGLIAQEVKATMDLLGVEFSGWNEDSNGKQGIQYAALVVPLIKAVQELSAKVKQLENK